MGTPKVTVLLPFYNSEKYLSEAIESILAQSFVDFEFLLIDDGSTDRSAEIAGQFKDPRIRLIKNPRNLGLTASLNIGLGLAQGELIARMDSDDVSMPERLKLQVSFMEKHPEIAVSGGSYETMSIPPKQVKHPLTADEINQELLFTGSVLAHPTAVIRKKLLSEKNAQYEEDYPHAEDYALWTTLSYSAPLANIPEILLRYRYHEGQISVRKTLEQQTSSARIRARLLTTQFGLKREEQGKLDQLFGPEVSVKAAALKSLVPVLSDILQKNQDLKRYPQARLQNFLLENWRRFSLAADVSMTERLCTYFSFPPARTLTGKTFFTFGHLVRQSVGVVLKKPKDQLREKMKTWLVLHPRPKVNIRVSGSLGDQLFLYALGIHLQHLYGEEVFFDVSGFQRFKRYRRSALRLKRLLHNQKFFKVSFGRVWISDLLRMLVKNGGANFRRIHYRRAPKSIAARSPGTTLVYEGIFRGPDLFRGSEKQVRTEFNFQSAVQGENLLSKLNQPQSVAVIVSKAPWLEQNGKLNVKNWPSQGAPGFYQSAIKLLQEKLKAPVFYLFSEDPDWATGLLSDLARFETIPQFSENSLEHLALVAACPNLIIAPSSFSWWAAWLGTSADRQIICSKSDWAEPSWTQLGAP